MDLLAEAPERFVEIAVELGTGRDPGKIECPSPVLTSDV